MSDNLIVYIAGLLFLIQLALQQLIKIVKLLRELQAASKGEASRQLSGSDTKGELHSGSP